MLAKRRYLDDGDVPVGVLEDLPDEATPDEIQANNPISPWNLYRKPPVEDIPLPPLPEDGISDIQGDALPPAYHAKTDYEKSIDPLKALLAQRPVETAPKWWQRLAAAGAGFAGGWTNAAGRTRPLDIATAQENILHPGFKNKLEEWQSRVAPAEALMQLESQKMTAQDKAEQIAAQAEERTAHAQQRTAMADPHYGLVQVDPKEFPLFVPDKSGQLWVPKADAVARQNETGRTVIVPAGSSVMVNGKITNVGAPKPITNAFEMWQRDHPNGTSDDYAAFESSNKADPENIAHWISMAEDPTSTPAQKAVANAKIKRLQQSQVQTHVEINAASPQNQPAQPVKEGTPEERVAKDLAFGKLTMAQFARLYSYSRDVNKKLAIYQKATDVNPNFNPALFEQGYRFFSTPKIQQQMASLNNVESGVPDLLKFSDLASRSGVTALNRLIVPGGVAVGGKHYSNFDAARTAFADELSGALGYGSATDMSREMGFNMTDRNLSPENFKSAIQDVIMPFIQRKRASLLGPMGIYGQPGGGGDVVPPPAQSGGGRGGAAVPARPPGVPADAHWDAGTRTWNR